MIWDHALYSRICAVLIPFVRMVLGLIEQRKKRCRNKNNLMIKFDVFSDCHYESDGQVDKAETVKKREKRIQAVNDFA